MGSIDLHTNLSKYIITIVQSKVFNKSHFRITDSKFYVPIHDKTRTSPRTVYLTDVNWYDAVDGAAYRPNCMLGHEI